MNDPASNQPAAPPHRGVDAVQAIGDVLTDLVELAEQLPVRLDQAEPAARILDRLSEELSEAAGMLRDRTRTADADLARLRQAFPRWRIAWVGDPDLGGFTASREFFPRINAVTAPVMAARILDREATHDESQPAYVAKKEPSNDHQH